MLSLGRRASPYVRTPTNDSLAECSTRAGRPMSRWARLGLVVTEAPYLILWTYLVYFICIVCMTWRSSDYKLWMGALVASALVGAGLNANAYRFLREEVDVGMVVRFFLIPFGVSALSGLANTLRPFFFLVFPRDPSLLVIAICTPAIAVVLLLLLRLTIIIKTKTPLTLKNYLFNIGIF